MQQQNAEGGSRRKSDRLLTRVSHDIRTPMNAIVGLSHLCLQTDINSRQREYLEKIQNAGVALVGILNDILDFSRIEADRVALDIVPFRLADLLQKVSDTVLMRAEKKGLEVSFHVAADVPEYFEGDSYRLYQTLVNLASNAVRFTEEGRIVISLELVERKDALLHLHFAIQDTGIGLSSEQVERIKNFFSMQPEDMPSEAPLDAGLGLVLAQMIVRLMDGKIWVESEAEHGSIFHVSLWLKTTSAPPMRTLPDELLRDMNVLVVDDNSSARLILSEALTSFGFRAETAESGQEALNMLRRACEQRDPFELVLLDWKMPGLDGAETARRIREDSTINTPPQLLMVSASNLEDCRIQGVEAGIHGFLIKPVTRSLLFDTIVQMFSQEKTCRSEMEKSAGCGGYADRLDILEGARILLVEDNEINQQIAMELLEQVGAVVVTANNGKEALDILQREQFDAVIMDIQMPIMDGLEAARRARALPVPGMRSLPILAMTAHALEDDREKSFQAGMQEHLTKPVDPRQMYLALAKWIQVRRASATADSRIDAASPAGLRDMPGLSVQSILKNLGGNELLYKKLLGSFVESYENLPRQLSVALNAGDRQLALRLTHTVKGVAANLGATSLTAVAGDLENSLAADREYATLLVHMGDVLRQTIESMRCLIGTEPNPERTVVRQKMCAVRQMEVIAMLRVAPDLMTSDWSAAQRQLHELESQLAHSAAASAYAALMLAVDDFDVGGAKEQAAKIITILQGSME